jgi:hypothetical protein
MVEDNGDKVDDELNTEDRIKNLEMSQEALSKYLLRVNQNMLGYLLILSLPMTTKRRLELTSSLLNSISLDDLVLRDVLIRYLHEGRLGEINFEQLLEPLVKVFGFDRLWKMIKVEDVREIFGEMAVIRWLELEKHSPCKKEVAKSG